MFLDLIAFETNSKYDRNKWFRYYIWKKKNKCEYDGNVFNLTDGLYNPHALGAKKKQIVSLDYNKSNE